jgi:hypothetical protein
MSSKSTILLIFILVGLILLTACGAQSAQTPGSDQVSDPESQKLALKAADPAGPSAVLSDLSGQVEVQQTADRSFVSAVAGMEVFLNGQVQTGPDGRVRLDFADGTIVRISPNSLFTLVAIEEENDGTFKQLYMQSGQMWVVLNGGSLQVDTPSGVASVRGSYMMVERDPETSNLVTTCLEGTCTLEVDGGEIVLGAGEKATFSGEGIEPGVMSQEEIQEWLDTTPEATLVLDQVPGSISDFAWEDWNGNGLQDDDEPGVAEVVVTLYSSAGDPLADTLTNGDGFYQFEEVFAGEYYLQFALESTLFTVQDAGEDDALDSDVDQEGFTPAFELAPGEHRTDLDAGLVYPGYAGICPFTGLPTDATLLENRPIFISISHFPAWATRPSTGLNSAPVVFETLIDQGMTRLQALFYCGYPEKLPESDGSGPATYDISGVRSGRVFYAELAELFGAGLIFGGADPSVYEQIAPYQCGVVDNTNNPTNIGGLGLDIESLEGIAERCKHRYGNPDFNVWTFGPPPSGGEPAARFLMHYNYLNQTRWDYDAEAGGYVRYQNDPETPEEFTLSTDKLTGQAVVRQNIILLVTPHGVLNSAGTIIEFDLTDERGFAWLLRDGAMYKACWSAVFNDYPTESNRYRPFLLYNCDTKEPLNFAYGSTWVNVVSPAMWFETEGDTLVAKQPFLGYGP